MNKKLWLERAEVLDAYRIIPRIILAATFTGYTIFAVDTYAWVRDIYAATGDIPTSVAAYAGGTLSALSGVLTLVINKYFEGGRKWTSKQPES